MAFFEHADVELWLARAGGRIAGRVAVIEDRLYNEKFGVRQTWFGFFEAQTQDAASALLASAEQRARERDSTTVLGPANPCLNESAGLLVDGFDKDPFLLMPYNPQEYASFIERAGYSKAKDLLAWTIELERPLGDRVIRIAERALHRQGIVVRPLDMRHFDRDLAMLQAVYRSAWSRNWGFVPPTDREIGELAAELRPIVDPNLVVFAEKDGRAIGCAVAVPDVNQVLKRMNGRLWPFGIFHFLRRRAIVDQVRLLLLGVVPHFRRRGLYPVLIADMYRRAQTVGYRRGELSWTLEDNEDINAGIEASGGRHYKTYRIYEKRVTAGRE
jgi:GNAT superfamily N-acetyltransferase